MPLEVNILRPYQRQPIHACIRRAAHESGISEYQVGIVMSWFLQELADQVSHGKIVRIPGFGNYGPVTKTPKGGADLSPYCYPGFCPSWISPASADDGRRQRSGRSQPGAFQAAPLFCAEETIETGVERDEKVPL